VDSRKRYELIRPILNGEKTVEEVAKANEVSDRTLYRYLARFREGNQTEISLADKSHAANSHPKWFSASDKAKVIVHKLKNPHLSARKIAQELTEQEILPISYHSVSNILKESSLLEHFFFRYS